MNPRRELKRTLVGSTESRTTGVVLSVEGETTKVRTPKGVLPVRSREGIAAGDSVLVDGGVIVGRVGAAESLDRYSV